MTALNSKIDDLLTHPQPVDKSAALHIAGGNKTGREELEWAQHEAFERAMIEARLRNAQEEQKRRLEFARADRRLDQLKPGSFYRKDWSKHSNTLNSRIGVVAKRERILRSLQVGEATVDTLGHQGRAWAQSRMGLPKERSAA